MSQMPQLRDILNDTPATAVDVDYNFGTLETHVAQELVNRDGTVAMTGALTLAGPAPSQPAHAVTKSYVDAQVVPTGVIWQYAAAAAPAGWAICDGAEKSSTDPQFTALFALIGYTYGQGAGNNFLMPDFRGRVAAGVNPGDATNFALGKKAGSKDLILPAHVHNIGNHQHGMKSHFHGMSNHVHYMNHRHDMSMHQHLSPARAGYDVNSANQPGQTNAIFPATGNTPLSFLTRRTAIMQSQEAGGSTDWTGAPNNNTTSWADRGDNTDGPNNNATGGPNDNTTDWGGATDTDSRGISPVNANLPPYTTINYIIKL